MECIVSSSGLFMALPDGVHAYGIKAINNAIIYDKLKAFFFSYRTVYKWFLQSDSDNLRESDESFLFIEFIGMNLDDNKALAFCEMIANEIGEKLEI